MDPTVILTLGIKIRLRHQNSRNNLLRKKAEKLTKLVCYKANIFYFAQHRADVVITSGKRWEPGPPWPPVNPAQ